ncbi:CRAL-TRIO domain-containing protein [Obelidium mucronatum]|nr:CRAL-TRIO domain-containing protein [Obelidium mucronatum]
MTGFDKLGQPVVYAIARLDETKTWDRTLKYAFWSIEKALKVADREGTEKLCLVLDNEGLGVFNAPPVSFITQFLGITEKHYPERLGAAIVLNPTWFIWGLYRLVSPFLDPVVKSKVFFATTTKKPSPEEDSKLKKSWSVANMFGKAAEDKEEAVAGAAESSEDTSGTAGWTKAENLIDVEHLPVQFGGNFEFVYDHETYWKAITSL